jgi:phosphate starvation-inducible protein PhoH
MKILNFLPIFLLLNVNSFIFKNSIYKTSLRFISMKKTNKIIHINYKAKNENQKKYVNFLNDEKSKIIVASGSAGTGKTLFACLKAIELLKHNKISKIVITRPAVTVEEDIGFLPGSLVKKMDPWTRPIFDLFEEFFSKNEIELMVQQNIIEISPLAFMRGRTFKNSFIIGDEMQNSSPNQMLMLSTRVGIDSRLVITGDLKQSDRLINNGLYDFIDKFKTYYNYANTTVSSNIKIVEFNDRDIERSEIVKEVLSIYSFDKKETEQNNVVKNEQTNKNLIVSNQNKSDIASNNIIYVNDTDNLNKNNFINDSALIPLNHLSKNFIRNKTK